MATKIKVRLRVGARARVTVRARVRVICLELPGSNLPVFLKDSIKKVAHLELWSSLAQTGPFSESIKSFGASWRRHAYRHEHAHARVQVNTS